MKNIFKKEVIVHHYGCDHVQSPWLSSISWKQQTVVNQGLRAPDTHYCKAIKIICRWMRGVCLQNADKDHTFMCKKKDLPDLDDIDNEINYCSTHFANHFVYALEIIGYKHQDEDVRRIAMNFYRGIVAELWHFNIETEAELDRRLADVNRPKREVRTIRPEGEQITQSCPVDEQDDPYLRRFN